MSQPTAVTKPMYPPLTVSDLHVPEMISNFIFFFISRGLSFVDVIKQIKNVFLDTTVPLKNKCPKIFAKYAYASVRMRICVCAYAYVCMRICTLKKNEGICI